MSASPALSRKRVLSGKLEASVSASFSSASVTAAERPIWLSARKLAFLSQTNFSPPKNGKVSSDSMVP